MRWPTAFLPGNSLSARPRVMITDEPLDLREEKKSSNSTSSSGVKPRPDVTCTPRVSRKSFGPMYIAAFAGEAGSSAIVDTDVFHDEPPNGTMFDVVTNLTPG